MAKVKATILYKYRGAVERGSRREMRPAFSPDGESGGVIQPWLTMRECQAQARAEGKRAAFQWKDDPTKDATTKTTTYTTEGFKRTALVLGTKPDDGSIDVLDRNGKRLCQINIFHLQPSESDGEGLIVDVIEVENRFSIRRALVFVKTKQGEIKREIVDVGQGSVVSADFREPLSRKEGA